MENTIDINFLSEMHNVSREEIIDCFDGITPEEIKSIILNINDKVLKLFNSRDIKDRFKIKNNTINCLQLKMICDFICREDIDTIIFVEDGVSHSYIQFTPYYDGIQDKYNIDKKTGDYLLDNLYNKIKKLYKSLDINDSFILNIPNVNLIKLESLLEMYCSEPTYDIINIEKLDGDFYKFSPIVNT